MLLSTHYRRPIDFSEEVVVAAKKGLLLFHRLFDRIERLAPRQVGDGKIAGEFESFGTTVQNIRQKFLEMMDDDFNTAGAIGVLHELSGAINGFLEQTNSERDKPAAALAAASAATKTLKDLGQILGLFRDGDKPAAKNDGLTEKLMALLIRLRHEARASKNFALADSIRKGLTELGVTLEDRAGETTWKAN